MLRGGLGDQRPCDGEREVVVQVGGCHREGDRSVSPVHLAVGKRRRRGRGREGEGTYHVLRKDLAVLVIAS
jgi:hypothetical protein